MANIYDMADTWNDSGTTFTAIKMDVTDTASAAGSLLMDLQVGGTSQFSVRKDGGLFIGPNQAPATRSDTTQAGAGSTAVNNIVSITQADYDLITPDADTIYFIEG